MTESKDNQSLKASMSPEVDEAFQKLAEREAQEFLTYLKERGLLPEKTQDSKNKENDSLMKDTKEFVEMTLPLVESLLHEKGIYPENPVKKPDTPLTKQDSTGKESKQGKLKPDQLDKIGNLLLPGLLMRLKRMHPELFKTSLLNRFTEAGEEIDAEARKASYTDIIEEIRKEGNLTPEIQVALKKTPGP